MPIDKLEKILDSEPIEEKQEKNIFSSMCISKNALKKARTYAELAEERPGSYIECYGYLLGNSNRQNRVIEDVYFAPNQTSSSAHTRIPAQSVIDAGKEIREMGRRVLGWWHSHASLPTFHSGTDDENHKTVLNQIAPSNYILTYEEMDFLIDDIKKTKLGDSTLYLCDRNNTSRRLEMIFKQEIQENPLAGIPIDKLIVRVPIQTSYAYSMVVNAEKAKPYTKIATRKFCPSCYRDEYNDEEIPLKILEYESDIEIDKDKMKKEVKEKLAFPKRRIIVVASPRFKVRIKGKVKRKKRGLIKTLLGIE
jgi:proteasome lid subunit RPN8/RPN11